MSDPLVSVIIPARNARSTIKKCLDSVRNSSYKNFELIVINDGSTDDTANILSGYNNIITLTTEGAGPSKARNIALAAAKGEFVAFTDADCLVDTHWLSGLLSGFTGPEVAGVGGAQKSPEDESWFGKRVQEFLEAFGFVSDYVKTGNDLRQTDHNPTCNSMYRRSVLAQTGGFLENLWPGEDVELDRRIAKMGYRLIFNPAAVVSHYRSPGLKNFSSMFYRYGKSQGFLVRRFGIFRLIQAVPFFILLLLCLLLYSFSAGFLIAAVFSAAVFFRAMIKSRYPFVIFGLFWVTLFCWNLGYAQGSFTRAYSGR